SHRIQSCSTQYRNAAPCSRTNCSAFRTVDGSGLNVAADHPGNRSLSGSSLPLRSFFFDGARPMIFGFDKISSNPAHVISALLPCGLVSEAHLVMAMRSFI